MVFEIVNFVKSEDADLAFSYPSVDFNNRVQDIAISFGNKFDDHCHVCDASSVENTFHFPKVRMTRYRFCLA